MRAGKNVCGSHTDTVDAVVQQAAMMFNVTPAEIATPGRGSRSTAMARHLAMYLLHVELQWSNQQIAKKFCRDPSSVRHAVRRVEELRDNPGFDLFLDRFSARECDG